MSDPTRKLTRILAFRGIALFTLFLVLLVGLSAPGQSTGASAKLENTTTEPVSPASSTALFVGQSAYLSLRKNAERGMPRDARVDITPRPGTPVFLPPVIYSTGADNPFSMAVADLNGDGKPDLVIGNQCTGPDYCGVPGVLGVLLGNGDGTFQSAVTYGSGGSVLNAIAVADVNGDGKPDLVAANAGQNSVGVLLGNGDGTFAPAVTYSSGAYSPEAVTLADVNGDGKPDLLVTHLCASPCDNISPPQGSVSVLLGKGDGTFRKAVSYATGGYFSFSIAVADLNGDGRADLVVTSWCASNVNVANCGDPGLVGVLLGNGDGTFQPVGVIGAGGTGTRAAAVADVNGDGKADLLVANCGPFGCGDSNPGGDVAVLLGNGDGTFQSPITFGSGTYFAISAADVDADGKVDIVVSNWTCANNEVGCVGVMLGNGDGTFQDAAPYDPESVNAGPNAVAVADLNGDGRLDLVATHGFGNGRSLPPGTVDVLLNNGQDSRSTTTTVAGSPNPAHVRQRVDYIATVTTESGGTPTGTITFRDGNQTLATLPLSGNKARLNYIHYTRNDLGDHWITASYSGDADNDPSTSAVFIEHVQQVSRVDLRTSGSPTFVGQPVTFSASVQSGGNGVPDGELITFYDGKTLLGTMPIGGGVATFTTSSLSAKRHTIRATYPGDSTRQPAAGAVVQQVNKYPTTASLSTSPNPSAQGQAVTFTVTVTSSGPFTPTGKVKFLDGTTGLGYATLSGSVATFSTSHLGVGTHSITAQYQGDDASYKSTSSAVNQVVNP
jgi:hypothetical protein